MKSKKPSKTHIFIGLIIVINLALFKYSVNIRKPWFGVLASSPHDPTGHHQWLTGSTIIFAKNWINEGPLNLKFGLFQNPKSIETNQKRNPYGSYPPGTIIPIYLIAKISGQEVSPSMVMGYNLVAHFLIGITLSLISFYVLRRLKVDDAQALIASTFPMLIQFLLPHPLYHHQNAYFSDQAVILPYVMYIFLEMLRFDPKLKKYSKKTKIFQFVINIWGLLTDWLFVFVNFFTYLKRIIQKQISTKPFKKFSSESLYFWIPSIAVIGLFLYQVLYIGAFEVMKKRFILRVGLNPDFADYQNMFIQYIYYHLQTGYGKFAPYILFISTIIFFVWAIYIYKNKQKLSNSIKNSLSTIISLVVIAPIIQLIVFRNHSAIHDFSVLKLSVFLSLIPFTILPILMFDFIRNFSDNKVITYLKNQKHTIYPKILIVLLTYVFLIHPRFRYLFPEPNTTMESIGNFVSENTNYSDIVFSSDIEAPTNPPQMLSYTMKRIYKFENVNTITDIAGPLLEKGNYRIVILEQVPSKSSPKEIQLLKSAAQKKVEGKDANLYFIEKQVFWSILSIKE